MNTAQSVVNPERILDPKEINISIQQDENEKQVKQEKIIEEFPPIPDQNKEIKKFSWCTCIGVFMLCTMTILLLAGLLYLYFTGKLQQLLSSPEDPDNEYYFANEEPEPLIDEPTSLVDETT